MYIILLRKKKDLKFTKWDEHLYIDRILREWCREMQMVSICAPNHFLIVRIYDGVFWCYIGIHWETSSRSDCWTLNLTEKCGVDAYCCGPRFQSAQYARYRQRLSLKTKTISFANGHDVVVQRVVSTVEWDKYIKCSADENVTKSFNIIENFSIYFSWSMQECFAVAVVSHITNFSYSTLGCSAITCPMQCQNLVHISVRTLKGQTKKYKLCLSKSVNLGEYWTGMKYSL